MQKMRRVYYIVLCDIPNECNAAGCTKFKQIDQDNAGTGWPRPIGCLIFLGHFPQKSPIISASFAESDVQLKASSENLRHPVSIKVSPNTALHT